MDKMPEGSELGLELFEDQNQKTEKNRRYTTDSKCICHAFIATISVNQLQNHFYIQQRKMGEELVMGLTQSHLFKDWNLVGMKALVKGFQYREYKKDQLIFKKGDPIN